VNTVDNELSYKRKFKKENQELEFFYAGSYSHNNTSYIQSQHYKTADTSFAGASSLNPGKENETDLVLTILIPLVKILYWKRALKPVWSHHQ